MRAWGGCATADVLTHADYLLVDAALTLEQCTAALRRRLAAEGAGPWALRAAGPGELAACVADGSLADGGDDFLVRVPVVRTMWLEESVARGRVRPLEGHCWGVLTFG